MRKIALKYRGFTLFELLAVIVVLGILALFGGFLFTNLFNNAEDAKKKADIQSMAQVYELNYSPASGYQILLGSQFVDGNIPTPPEGIYYNDLQSNGGYRVCAAIKGGVSPCMQSSSTCYCKQSKQIGYVPLASPSPSSGGALAHPLSCDPGQSLDNQLVTYLRFDESSGSTANDSAGDNDGAVSNANFTNGYPNSSAMNFGNGISISPGSSPQHYVDLGNTASLNILGPMSISVWVRPATTDGTTIILSKSAGSTSTIQYELLKSGVDAQFRISNGSSIITASSLGAFSSGGTWQHIVAVFNGSDLVVYKNGIAGTAVPFVGTQTNYNNNVIVGRRSNGSLANSSGIVRIDDLRIYDRELLPVDVAKLYNDGEGCLP